MTGHRRGGNRRKRETRKEKEREKQRGQGYRRNFISAIFFFTEAPSVISFSPRQHTRRKSWLAGRDSCNISVNQNCFGAKISGALFFAPPRRNSEITFCKHCFETMSTWDKKRRGGDIDSKADTTLSFHNLKNNLCILEFLYLYKMHYSSFNILKEKIFLLSFSLNYL